MDQEANVGQNGGSAGPIIGTIVILAVIVLGGLYFWGQSGEEVMEEETTTEEEVMTEETTTEEETTPATEVEGAMEVEVNAS